jgi:hypothetical protein
VNQGGANAVIPGPPLVDGLMNEFRFLDPPANAVPLRVPVAAGQAFIVSLQFQNQSSGNPLAPSVVFDADGCQAGANAVDLLPGGWSDACPLGVTGDWVIRAVIDCHASGVPASGPPGALVLGALLLAAGLAAARRLRPRRVPS